MSDFDGPEMHETWQRCAGDCGHDRLLEELSTRGLCPECERLELEMCLAGAEVGPDPEDRPRVRFRRLPKWEGHHEALTVWVDGGLAGVLTVRRDETAVLDWIIAALEAHGGTENR